MRLLTRDIDEYTLAAYLAGKLTPRRRREVARMLAESEDARDLVLAARELLDLQGDGQNVDSEPDAISDLVFNRERLKAAFLIAAIGVLVVAVAATTMMAIRFRSEVAALRATVHPLEDSAWRVGLALPAGAIEWEGIPGAASYHVVFWNPRTGRPSFETEVVDLRYDLEDAPETLGPDSHTIWIEAIDEDGSALRRTRAIPVRRSQ